MYIWRGNIPQASDVADSNVDWLKRLIMKVDLKVDSKDLIDWKGYVGQLIDD